MNSQGRVRLIHHHPIGPSKPWEEFVSVESVDYTPQTKDGARYGRPDPLGLKMNTTVEPRFIGNIFEAGPRKLLKKP